MVEEHIFIQIDISSKYRELSYRELNESAYYRSLRENMKSFNSINENSINFYTVIEPNNINNNSLYCFI